MNLDLDTIRTIADIGLGAFSLMLFVQQSRLIKDHEHRITALESDQGAKPRRRHR